MRRLRTRIILLAAGAVIAGSGFAFMAGASIDTTSASEGTGAVDGFGFTNMGYLADGVAPPSYCNHAGYVTIDGMVCGVRVTVYTPLGGNPNQNNPVTVEVNPEVPGSTWSLCTSVPGDTSTVNSPPAISATQYQDFTCLFNAPIPPNTSFTQLAFMATQ